MIVIGHEIEFAKEHIRNCLSQGEHLLGSLIEKMVEHLEALIVEGEFIAHIGAVKDEVKVILFCPRIERVSPAVSVIVNTKDEVWFDSVVDEFGSGVDLGGAVEYFFGLFSFWKVGKEIFRRFFCNRIKVLAD